MPQTMVSKTCRRCSCSFQITLGASNQGAGTYCSRHCKCQAILENAPERFWSQVDKISSPNGCWLWNGIVNVQGYGRFFSRGKWHQAHRYSWIDSGKIIPKGFRVCHKCDNPPCVNPSHLFVGTSQDNADDMVKKGRSTAGDKNPSRRYPGLHRGEKNGNAKLTPEQVCEIRDAYKGKNHRFRKVGPTLQELAVKYGVTNEQIHCIISFKSWANETTHLIDVASEG